MIKQFFLISYVTIFDYIDKILIILSATTSVLSIISFTILLEHQLE